MLFTELEPRFLKIESDRVYNYTDSIKDADGVIFSCPTCFVKNGNSVVGTHSIIWWQPHGPQTANPVPGRWNFVGTDLTDISFVNGSSSIALTGGCNAHFFIRNGKIEFA